MDTWTDKLLERFRRRRVVFVSKYADCTEILLRQISSSPGSQNQNYHEI